MPLLKEMHGDASMLDMCIGITLSCVASKLFKSVLLALFGDSMNSDYLQFGFKKNNSCCHLYLMSQCDISLDVIVEFTVPR